MAIQDGDDVECQVYEIDLRTKIILIGQGLRSPDGADKFLENSAVTSVRITIQESCHFLKKSF